MTPTRRLEVRCLCGKWGRLIWKGKIKDNKDVCSFTCSCDVPNVDYDNPYKGWD